MARLSMHSQKADTEALAIHTESHTEQDRQKDANTGRMNCCLILTPFLPVQGKGLLVENSVQIYKADPPSSMDLSTKARSCL